MTGREHRLPEVAHDVEHGLTGADYQEILEHYQRRLHEIRSPLMDNAETVGSVLRQARSILDSVVEAFRTGACSPATIVDSTDTRPEASKSLSQEIGKARARHGIHPTVSMYAATILFEVALPVIARAYANEWDRDVVGLRAAVILHQAVFERVANAVVPYASFLLTELQHAHRAERQRLARELHDRAAHGVGVALQNLELEKIYHEQDPPRARAKLVAAEQTLREALDTIRRLSAELREQVGARGLAEAVADYLRDNVPPHIRVINVVTGDGNLLPPEISEELYIIVREAIRNALLHSRTSVLRVSLNLSETLASASIEDEGIGFDVETTTAPACGLSSMRERAALLGGVLNLNSRAEQGTSATVAIPLAGGRG